MSQQLQYFTQNLFTVINQRNFLSLFKTKGKQNLDPFDYLNQYCRVTIALIIEGIFISKTVTSLQIKVHEVYAKPLNPREALLTTEESDNDSESDSEKDEIKTLNISDIEEEDK